MTLLVPSAVLRKAAAESSDKWLLTKAESNARWSQDSVRFETSDLTDQRLAALVSGAEEAGDKAYVRVLEAITSARGGKTDVSVPRLTAFPEMLVAFLKAHKIDGWIYRQDPTGFVKAYLVTDVTYTEPRDPNDKPSVTVTLAQTGVLGDSSRSKYGKGLSTSAISLYGADVTRKKVADIITEEGYLVETKALRAIYDEQTEHHREVLERGFSEQFLYTGNPASSSPDGDRYGRGDTTPRARRKVISNTPRGGVDITETTNSSVYGETHSNPEADSGYDYEYARKGIKTDSVTMAVPMAHYVQVFDLAVHEFMVVASTGLTWYKYDSSLADKLVLPESHRDLLDILTTDIATFTGDIIEGKSAGNVILSKGVPGVGKTLTAEVYAELIERPLYSIHSGSLGVTADSVRKSLETVFKRAKGWNAVLLLDEADVFVNERGTDITQNAIVAEFLRTMEYFDGLMFMTTNRAANIDEAVISRCAAIIDYQIPETADAIRIWHVLADNFGIDLADDLAIDLQAAFFDIAPRDIKMLLRLGARVSLAKKVPLDLDVFRKVSMFRGLNFHEHKAGA